MSKLPKGRGIMPIANEHVHPAASRDERVEYAVLEKPTVRPKPTRLSPREWQGPDKRPSLIR